MTAAVLAQVGAISVPTADGPDADLIRLSAEYVALTHEMNRLMESDGDNVPAGDPAVEAQIKALVSRCHEMRDTIAALPATTSNGLRAKAAFVLHYVSADADHDADPAISESAGLLSDDHVPAHSLVLDVLRAPEPVQQDLDAELIAACAAFDALERQSLATFRTIDDIDGQDAGDAERDRISKLQEPHLDRILDLRATTITGVQAKARSLALEDQELLKPGPGDRRDCLISSIVEDLIGESLATEPSVPDLAVATVCDEARHARSEVAAAPRAMDDETFGLLLDRARDAIFAVASTPTASLAAVRLQARALLEEHEFEQAEAGKQADGGFNHGTAERGALLLLKQLAGVPAPLPPDPDAGLKAACNELIASIDQMNVEGLDIPFGSEHPLRARQRELLAQILAQSPSTIEGHQLRARAVLEWHGGMGGDGEPASCLDHDDIWPVIRDLIGATTIEAMSKRTAAICASYPATVP